MPDLEARLVDEEDPAPIHENLREGPRGHRLECEVPLGIELQGRGLGGVPEVPDPARAAGRKPAAAAQRTDGRKNGGPADERCGQQEERGGCGFREKRTTFLTQGGSQDTLLVPTS